MTQSNRLPAQGRIDRTRPLRFRFDNRQYQGYAGDTLASALLANGSCLTGRSFKYHRPRGILSAGSEEPNALVTIDRGQGRVTPNLRATQVELYEGLTAHSQNRWPGPRFDAGAAAQWFSPLLSAGFYYKTFLWPRSFWRRLYEPAIRRAAGLGRAPLDPDPDKYANQYAHCDVLIIGAGPAGLAAAWGASATGARVILADEQTEPGGSLLSEPGVKIDGIPGPDWVRQLLAEISPRVTVLPRTTAFGWYPGQMIALAQRLAEPGPIRERLWQVRAGRVVLATGAIERPLTFPGNDRPGVMLAGAARTYLNRYGVTVGKRAVIATAHDSAYRAALDLHAAGVTIAAIADQRPSPDSQAVSAVRALGIPVHPGTTIANTLGRLRIHTAILGNNAGVIPCDTLLMSGGWTPSVHLFSQSRRKPVFDAASGTFLPTGDSVGACAGVFDLATCLRDGTRAGGSQPRDFTVTGIPAMTAATPPAPTRPHPEAFIDFQNDVTSKDLAIATTEGFTAIEHVKRYTTTGMATDQGKTSNLNALATVAALTGQPMEAIGLTTFRPPFTPVTFGTLAGPYRGALYDPIRLPPIATPGAVLENVGTWKRARCFPGPGESEAAAAAREHKAVRASVGIFDASTLGKIEVTGPDAAAFLSRIYTGDYRAMAIRTCRYAVLLSEDGFIRDDGIIARLAPDRFHVTTTTGNAAFVAHHMEDYLQTEYTDLRAWLTSTTEQWAVIAVQGPDAAAIIAPLLPDIDIAAMPHMTVREATLDGMPIRLFRVSFTGESGFEINLPPTQAQRVWDTLLALGATPYGTDAMHSLRAEKGYVIVGQETDGTVTPDDVGLGWTIRRSKGDFVGTRSLTLPDLVRPGRRQLVGLRATGTLQEGAQVTVPGGRVSIGHVTSAYPGTALAMIESGRTRIGEALAVDGMRVTVTGPVTYDKPGERLRPGSLPACEPLALLPAAPPQAPESWTGDGVSLTALGPATRLSIRADAQTATAIGLALGCLLPTVPCRSAVARERAALWCGPDEWLVIAPDTAADLGRAAQQASAGRPASVVDVSHRTLALQVSGPNAAWHLNGHCALDLDPRAFPPGMCTRTLLGKAEATLWRTAPDTFRIEVARSLFPYARACLT